MNAPVRSPLGKSSPRGLRDYKPRLSFNWRCVECGMVFVAPTQEGYHCGQYAVDADEGDE
jgi:hypothetical protein